MTTMTTDTEMPPFSFQDFLEAIGVQDSFRTYGIVFEAGLKEEVRRHLIENDITEKRNGVRGVNDVGVLDKGDTFYTVGVFLKCLHELGFHIEETMEEEADFCGDFTRDTFQILVDFNYGSDVVGYKVLFSDVREHQSHENQEEFLAGILNGGWGLPKFEGVLNPSSLYDDLETFMRDFRKSWGKYQKIVEKKDLEG
jgi:hypothetical protein